MLIRRREPLRRSAFTLLELMAVVVVSATLLGSALPLLLRQQRHVLATADASSLRRSAHHGASSIAYEMRHLATHAGDLSLATPTAFEFRSWSGTGVVCTVDSTRTRLSVPPLTLSSRAALTTWVAAPRSGDSVLVFDSGRRPGPEDDRWRAYELAADATPARCPESSGFVASASESAAGWGIRLSAPIDDAIGPGVPIRFFRHARYQLYRSTADGGDYLGYTECPGGRCAAVQPVAGPFAGLTASAGLVFDFRDSVGAATADVRQVKRIDVVMRVRSRLPFQGGGRRGAYVDSIALIVAPRNALP